MKKILSFLLALCLLIPLGVTPAFAAVSSAEEFEQLKQKAEIFNKEKKGPVK